MVNVADSIWTKYKSIVEENKNRRKIKGDWSENEAAELVCDTETPIAAHWKYTNLLSARWVQDLFGVDWTAVQTLMYCINNSDCVFVNDVLYYREQQVDEALEVLQILAKSTIINMLRPIPQIIKEMDEPIYTSKDMMRILNVKESTLSKLRNKFELGYTKFGDKIVYTHADLMNFIYNPKYRVEVT